MFKRLRVVLKKAEVVEQDHGTGAPGRFRSFLEDCVRDYWPGAHDVPIGQDDASFRINHQSHVAHADSRTAFPSKLTGEWLRLMTNRGLGLGERLGPIREAWCQADPKEESAQHGPHLNTPNPGRGQAPMPTVLQRLSRRPKSGDTPQTLADGRS